jgi:hypothetical protein
VELPALELGGLPEVPASACNGTPTHICFKRRRKAKKTLLPKEVLVQVGCPLSPRTVSKTVLYILKILYWLIIS